MAELNIILDDELKEQGERLFSEKGMSLSAAVVYFIAHSVNNGSSIIEITDKTEIDNFYGEKNMAILRKGIADMEAGRNITQMTVEEFERMCDE